VITATGSKYRGASPALDRNEAGIKKGKSSAITLNKYDVPVPNAISVNMFKCRLTTEAHPRWSNGQPPHNTTGVPNTN
jgi:hypothetical protein